MKYPPATAAAVESAKRAINDIVRSCDALMAAEALDDVGAVLGRCMESVDAEAELLRAARTSRRSSDA